MATAPTFPTSPFPAIEPHGASGFNMNSVNATVFRPRIHPFNSSKMPMVNNNMPQLYSNRNVPRTAIQLNPTAQMPMRSSYNQPIIRPSDQFRPNGSGTPAKTGYIVVPRSTKRPPTYTQTIQTTQAPNYSSLTSMMLPHSSQTDSGFSSTQTQQPFHSHTNVAAKSAEPYVLPDSGYLMAKKLHVNRASPKPPTWRLDRQMSTIQPGISLNGYPPSTLDMMRHEETQMQLQSNIQPAQRFSGHALSTANMMRPGVTQMEQQSNIQQAQTSNGYRPKMSMVAPGGAQTQPQSHMQQVRCYSGMPRPQNLAHQQSRQPYMMPIVGAYPGNHNQAAPKPVRLANSVDVAPVATTSQAIATGVAHNIDRTLPVKAGRKWHPNTKTNKATHIQNGIIESGVGGTSGGKSYLNASVVPPPQASHFHPVIAHFHPNHPQLQQSQASAVHPNHIHPVSRANIANAQMRKEAYYGCAPSTPSNHRPATNMTPMTGSSTVPNATTSMTPQTSNTPNTDQPQSYMALLFSNSLAFEKFTPMAAPTANPLLIATKNNSAENANHPLSSSTVGFQPPAPFKRQVKKSRKRQPAPSKPTVLLDSMSTVQQNHTTETTIPAPPSNSSPSKQHQDHISFTTQIQSNHTYLESPTQRHSEQSESNVTRQNNPEPKKSKKKRRAPNSEAPNTKNFYQKVSNIIDLTSNLTRNEQEKKIQKPPSELVGLSTSEKRLENHITIPVESHPKLQGLNLEPAFRNENVNQMQNFGNTHRKTQQEKHVTAPPSETPTHSTSGNTLEHLINHTKPVKPNPKGKWCPTPFSEFSAQSTSGKQLSNLIQAQPTEQKKKRPAPPEPPAHSNSGKQLQNLDVWSQKQRKKSRISQTSELSTENASGENLENPFNVQPKHQEQNLPSVSTNPHHATSAIETDKTEIESLTTLCSPSPALSTLSSSSSSSSRSSISSSHSTTPDSSPSPSTPDTSPSPSPELPTFYLFENNMAWSETSGKRKPIDLPFRNLNHMFVESRERIQWENTVSSSPPYQDGDIPHLNSDDATASDSDSTHDSNCSNNKAKSSQHVTRTVNSLLEGSFRKRKRSTKKEWFSRLFDSYYDSGVPDLESIREACEKRKRARFHIPDLPAPTYSSGEMDSMLFGNREEEFQIPQ
ncbi:hypothetical protein HDU97_009721 [Phlyctochytrium planicorne]|nr:hypothetical protein HDU97_009721 [Phlyctochytrium planicorne]